MARRYRLTPISPQSFWNLKPPSFPPSSGRLHRCDTKEEERYSTVLSSKTSREKEGIWQTSRLDFSSRRKATRCVIVDYFLNPFATTAIALHKMPRIIWRVIRVAYLSFSGNDIFFFNKQSNDLFLEHHFWCHGLNRVSPRRESSSSRHDCVESNDDDRNVEADEIALSFLRPCNNNNTRSFTCGISLRVVRHDYYHQNVNSVTSRTAISIYDPPPPPPTPLCVSISIYDRCIRARMRNVRVN